MDTQWDQEEIARLLKLDRASEREAAEIIGRSIYAIRKMRQKTKNGWSPVVFRWNNSEIKIARSVNLSNQQVADLTGRTIRAVAAMRRVLSETEGLEFSSNRIEMQPFIVGHRRLLAKTCIGCGLLLDASWFSRARGREWTSRCTRCEKISVKTGKNRNKGRKRNNKSVVSGKLSRALAQKITREKATRHRYPWINADHEVLRDSTKSGFEKAILLGRTLSATNEMVRRSGYTSRVGKGDPMNGVWRIANARLKEDFDPRRSA